MGKRRPKSCHLLFFYSIFFLFLVNPSSASQQYAREIELLLSFKASVFKDPSRVLSNWNPSVHICQWNGITCNDFSGNITAIELSGRNISGMIPDMVFHLPHIQVVDFSNNQFVGKLPPSMFSAGSSLLHLNLSNNNFTGRLPNGGVSGLRTLDLSNNMISGTIPEDVGLFSSLGFLDLGGNVLDGEIPNSITNLTSLQFLTLASNKLVGEIPRELRGMKRLKWIYLGYNNLSGEIPEEICQLNSLNHLDLVYNKLSGKIPESLGNLTQLRYLFLYQNDLTGTLPHSIFSLEKLISLDISDNSISGEIPELVIQLQKLEILHLFGNNFTGRIPSALASLPRLQVLQLWSNRFSGEIPEQLGKRNNLTVVDVSSNRLTGKLPDGLCDSGRLFKLILFTNSLQGEIPKSLSSCKSLRRVRLQNNRFSGELASEFMKLPLLYFLDISGNKFSGRIDSQKWDMPSLQMMNLARNKFSGNLPEFIRNDKLENLDLSANDFSGPIPEGFGNLSELMLLNLSNNKLAGQIPNRISSCMKLVSLDLSHNQLSGSIPVSLTQMKVLSLLDLSENQLSGEIPPSLGRVESLVQINISHNHFHGTLPSTGAFLAINASAVAGNELCGGDSTSELPPCRNHVKSNPAWWYLLTCSLLVLAVFLAATAVFVFIRRRKHQKRLKRVENEHGIWELQFFDSNASKLITVDAVLSSLNAESSMSMANKETQFFVEKINMKDVENSVLPGSFWSEIAELGKLRHPNVVRLLGTCRSEKGVYLVREYVHGQYLNEVVGKLSWERRHNIAVGIGRALQFLNRRCSPGVITGKFSPGKIIVDEKDEPRLMIGLSCVPVPGTSKSFISSGYSAPEAKEGKDITEKSNVYTFGLILIELLTGKGPVDPELAAHHQELVDWARYCYSDCHLDTWIDHAITGPTSSANQNQIVGMMNLALHCTAADPMARPSSRQAYKTLLALSRSRITYCSELFSS